MLEVNFAAFEDLLYRVEVRREGLLTTRYNEQLKQALRGCELWEEELEDLDRGVVYSIVHLDLNELYGCDDVAAEIEKLRLEVESKLNSNVAGNIQ